jgi:hypothetical protein
MYVPFRVFYIIILFSALFVYKCVLYRVSTQLQLTNNNNNSCIYTLLPADYALLASPKHSQV